MRVGFLGLGHMGAAMAANLVKAGHEVHVWNRSPEPVQALVAQGAIAAASPAEAVASGIVLSMLANDAAFIDVMMEQGVLSALPVGSIHVVHSTLSVALVREMASRHAHKGIGFVCAPVFGRPEVAQAGALNMLVAGDAKAIATVNSLLQAMSTQQWPLGDAPEKAAIVKIAGNLMLASVLETISEASALTRGYGVPAKELINIMTATMFGCGVYKNYGATIAGQNFTPPGFSMPLGLKDVGLALAAGHDAQVPLPLAGLIRESMIDALAHEGEGVDWSALALVAERRANLKDRGL